MAVWSAGDETGHCLTQDGASRNIWPNEIILGLSFLTKKNKFWLELEVEQPFEQRQEMDHFMSRFLFNYLNNSSKCEDRTGCSFGSSAVRSFRNIFLKNFIRLKVVGELCWQRVLQKGPQSCATLMTWVQIVVIDKLSKQPHLLHNWQAKHRKIRALFGNRY